MVAGGWWQVAERTWKWVLVCKGAPARESRTGTRLVSPATGWKKKKKDTSTSSTQNIKLSTLDYNIGSKNYIRSSTAPKEAIKH